MTRRTCVWIIALAGLCSQPLARGVDASKPFCFGVGSGAWDLPEQPGASGTIDGALISVPSPRDCYRLLGRVDETPLPCTTRREGAIECTLEDAGGRALYDLVGEWKSNDVGGQGEWNATIFQREAPKVAVGALQGTFSDSVRGKPGELHAFWTLACSNARATSPATDTTRTDSPPDRKTAR
jgi:hypothetical protein